MRLCSTEQMSKAETGSHAGPCVHRSFAENQALLVLPPGKHPASCLVFAPCKQRFAVSLSICLSRELGCDAWFPAEARCSTEPPCPALASGGFKRRSLVPGLLVPLPKLWCPPRLAPAMERCVRTHRRGGKLGWAGSSREDQHGATFPCPAAP